MRKGCSSLDLLLRKGAGEEGIEYVETCRCGERERGKERGGERECVNSKGSKERGEPAETVPTGTSNLYAHTRVLSQVSSSLLQLSSILRAAL